MIRASFIFGFVALSAACTPERVPPTGADTSPVVSVASTPAAPSTGPTAEERAIRSLVEASQRAGLVDHRLEPYLAPWDADAVLVGGRGPEPGAGDWSLSREQNEAVKRLRFSESTPADLELTFRDAEVRIEGDRAILTWTAASRGHGWSEVVGERYELRKRGGAWRIVSNRFWPVETRQGGERVVFDAAGLAELDAAVAEAEQSGDPLAHCQALMRAWRFPEAHQVAKRATAEPDAGAAAWGLRATAAMLVGDVQDAKTARARAGGAGP